MSVTNVVSIETLESTNQESAFDFVMSSAGFISRYGDFTVKTPDGKTWGLFLQSEGDIPSKFVARRLDFHFRNAKRGEELCEEIRTKIAGFIVEVDSDCPARIFTDRDEAIHSWVELHQQNGVSISETDRLLLDLPAEEDVRRLQSKIAVMSGVLSAVVFAIKHDKLHFTDPTWAMLLFEAEDAVGQLVDTILPLSEDNP